MSGSVSGRYVRLRRSAMVAAAAVLATLSLALVAPQAAWAQGCVGSGPVQACPVGSPAYIYNATDQALRVRA